MDPLTAISLSGTILQFVQLGIKCLKLVRELYCDGEREKYLEASALAKQVEYLNSTAVDQCRDFKLKLVAEPLLETIPKRFDKHDTLLESLCHSCRETAQTLEERLAKVRVPRDSERGKLKSVYHALVNIWSSAKEIEALIEKLKNYRRDVETVILVSISSKLDFILIQQSETFKSLSQENQMIISDLLKMQDATTRAFQTIVQALSLLLSRTERVTRIQKGQRRVIIRDVLVAAPWWSGDASAASFAVSERKLRQVVAEELLRSLRFHSIKARYDTVNEAHEKTFQWIFQKQESHQRWSDFSKWLREDNGIYWINGKAASGKSTLMKYIMQDPRTVQLLQLWSAKFPQPERLCIANFFFWSSGTEEQSSQSGLLRSILYEILCQHPRLLPILFPGEWSSSYSRHLQADFSAEFMTWDLDTHITWELSSLKAGVTRLLCQTEYPLQLCLFVDGLDEYEGDETEIATLFSRASKALNVKCCVSSRPHLPFRVAFVERPSLVLETLTVPDIIRFVTDTLGASHLWKNLASQNSQGAQDLIDDVVAYANGVFLWVTIVVASLLRGLGSNDDISKLQERLRALPRKLETLYDHIIFKVDEIYQEERSRIFRLVHTAARLGGTCTQLTLLQLSLALDFDFDFTLKANPDSFTEAQMYKRCVEMETRLITRCGGLLELQRHKSLERLRNLYEHNVSANVPVSYLHRTVQEYLEKKELQSILQQRASLSTLPQFNPHLAIVIAYLLQLNLDINLQISLLEPGRAEKYSTSDVIMATLTCLRAMQDDESLSHFIYLNLCDRLFSLIGQLSKNNKDVESHFPPSRDMLTTVREARLDRYLQYLTPRQPVKNMEALLKEAATIQILWAKWFDDIMPHRENIELKSDLKFFIEHAARITEEDLDILRLRLPRACWDDIEKDLAAHQLPIMQQQPNRSKGIYAFVQNKENRKGTREHESGSSRCHTQ